MADDDSKDRPDEREQSSTPEPDPEPEPEGGPLERAKAFLEERFSTLGPKRPPGEESVGETPSARAAAAVAPEGAEAVPPEIPEAARRRQESLRQFRARQSERRQSERQSGGAARAGERESTEEGSGEADEEPHPSHGIAPPPPQPPAPAPANNWIAIGPSVLRQGQGGVKPATSGRTPAIAVVPGGHRIYAGAANGGVWRSLDTGRTWRSLMDAFDLDPTAIGSDSLACGAVAVVAGATAATDRVYVGSGEGAGGAYFGVGPLVSHDGGANWLTEPVAAGSPQLVGSAFYALAVDPADPDRVVGATRRGVYRREPDGGGGFHWARKTLAGAATVGATSVVVASSAGSTTFYATFRNGPIYSSTDGHTWSQVGSGLPGGLGRIALAVQAGNPSVVYALAATERLFRLDTSDGVWREATGVPAGFLGTQGWYDLAIAVAPDEVDRIYLGGSTVLSGGDWSGSLYRAEVTVAAGGVSLAATYIGGSVHADIHTIVFAPGDAAKLWVGCDGGVFYTTNPLGSGNIFESKNTGLQTMTMNYLGQHPTEDAVLFCGTQDNGGVRFTGEEAWLYSSGGDGGFAIVNWQDPYRVLSTYVRGGVRRSSDGGSRYSYSSVNVPLVAGDDALFYAPIAGAPRNPGSPAEADVVAFGSIRPWVSTSFGGGWQSIPGNDLAADSLDAQIKSLAFASATKLYAGTMGGGVYRFDRNGAAWTRTRIDTVGGAAALPLAGVVTDLAVDPADASGDSIYLAFGGSGDFRHVWHFDGSQWQARSGPAAGAPDSLLDIQHNAIAVDPANPQHLYVGADIGCWRSTDGGATWAVFSEGLPDASVLDLALHDPRRLLRAATHGRGVFERTLDTLPKQGVELYVRDTQLDQGRFATVNGLPDPTDQGETVRHWRGPDIRLDTPDAGGNYQFPLGSEIDFHQFVDTLSDDFRNVATHATANIVTRVYVQVHNRGVVPADGVRVMALVANASAGLPPVPPGLATNVQSGTPIATADWQTLGFETLDDVRPGFPKIAGFDLPSSLLPPPLSLAGNDHHCVLALVHHPDDPFGAATTHTDTLSRTNRKSAHKNLKVVQFTGTVPAPPPAFVAVRIHNADLERELRSDLVVRFPAYRGGIRLLVPDMEVGGDWERAVDGLRRSEQSGDLRRWAGEQIERIERNQRTQRPYNPAWARQQEKDIRLALDSGRVFRLGGGKGAIRGIVLPPGGRHTVFLAIERPPDAGVGKAHAFSVSQWDAATGEVIGGLDGRVELVPEPELQPHRLTLSARRWLFGHTLFQARLTDGRGKRLGPADGAEVALAVRLVRGGEKSLGTMRYHRGWRAWTAFERLGDDRGSARATATIGGAEVADAKTEI